MKEMTTNQPYLLRAFFDWILDNELTPYMVVDANYPDVQIPTQFVNNGQIVLNVSPSACVNFSIDLEWVEFQARFSGQPMLVSFPCVAVAAIYAKENGAGTAFQVPSIEDVSLRDDTDNTEAKTPSTLTSVSNNEDESGKQEPSIAETKSDAKDKTKSKPSLHVIK